MAALFDLDGTITGSHREKKEMRDESLNKFGIPEISSGEYYEAFREVISNGKKVDTRVPIFKKILDDDELAEKVAKEYRKKSLKNIYVYTDAEEILNELPGKKGLVTNGPKSVQREKIKKFGLERYFDSIVISGEVGKSKPEPEIFSLALKSLGLASDGSFYVGDIPSSDVAGAKNAGLTSILINRNEEAHNFYPDYEIEDLRELFDII